MMARLSLMFLLIGFAAYMCFSTAEVWGVEGSTQQLDRFPVELNQEGEELVNVMKLVLHGGSMTMKPLQWVDHRMRNGDVTLDGNVRCGDGYCPTEAPICCGQTPSHYCIPGGSKCCDAPGRGETACGQDTECCPLGRNVTCCGKGTVCVRDSNETGCIEDVCASHNTADACLRKEKGCGWCCEEQRCVSPGRRCSMGGAPILSGSVCPSRCQYADTCGLCLLQQERNPVENCFWCCSTQSCISSSEAIGCANRQVVDSLSQCPACQANGDGIDPTFIGTYAQFLSILSGVVLFIGIMSCIGVIRAFMCYRSSIVTQNGMRLADVDAQLAVRRHGFGSSEPPFFQRQAKNKLRRFLSTIISLLRSNSKSRGERDEISPPNGVLGCAECHRPLQARALTSIINSLKGTTVRRSKTTEDPIRKDRYGDTVILLPCGHFFCRSCMGLRLRESSLVVAEDKHTKQPQFRVPVQLDTDDIHGEYFPPSFGAGDCATKSEDREPLVSESFTGLLAEEHRNLPHRILEGLVVGSEEANVTERRESSHSQDETWRGGLLRSLHRIKVQSDYVNVEDDDDESIVQKKIKRKCPLCKHAVKDVFLPENILQI